MMGHILAAWSRYDGRGESLWKELRKQLRIVYRTIAMFRSWQENGCIVDVGIVYLKMGVSSPQGGKLGASKILKMV